VLTGVVLEDLSTAAERRSDRTTVNPSFIVSAMTVESLGAPAAAR